MIQWADDGSDRVTKRIRTQPIVYSDQRAATLHLDLVQLGADDSPRRVRRVNGFANWRYGADWELDNRTHLAGVRNHHAQRIWACVG